VVRQHRGRLQVIVQSAELDIGRKLRMDLSRSGQTGNGGGHGFLVKDQVTMGTCGCTRHYYRSREPAHWIDANRQSVSYSAVLSLSCSPKSHTETANERNNPQGFTGAIDRQRNIAAMGSEARRGRIP
jgi:hypothetical protein